MFRRVTEGLNKSGGDIDYASKEGRTKLRGSLLQTIAEQKLKKHPDYKLIKDLFPQKLAKYRKMFVDLSGTDEGQQKLTDFYNKRFAKTKWDRLPNIPTKEKWPVVPKGDVKEKSVFISAKDRLDKSGGVRLPPLSVVPISKMHEHLMKDPKYRGKFKHGGTHKEITAAYNELIGRVGGKGWTQTRVDPETKKILSRTLRTKHNYSGGLPPIASEKQEQSMFISAEDSLMKAGPKSPHEVAMVRGRYTSQEQERAAAGEPRLIRDPETGKPIGSGESPQPSLAYQRRLSRKQTEIDRAKANEAAIVQAAGDAGRARSAARGYKPDAESRAIIKRMRAQQVKDRQAKATALALTNVRARMKAGFPEEEARAIEEDNPKVLARLQAGQKRDNKAEALRLKKINTDPESLATIKRLKAQVPPKVLVKKKTETKVKPVASTVKEGQLKQTQTTGMSELRTSMFISAKDSLMKADKKPPAMPYLRNNVAWSDLNRVEREAQYGRMRAYIKTNLISHMAKQVPDPDRPGEKKLIRRKFPTTTLKEAMDSYRRMHSLVKPNSRFAKWYKASKVIPVPPMEIKSKEVADKPPPVAAQSPSVAAQPPPVATRRASIVSEARLPRTPLEKVSSASAALKTSPPVPKGTKQEQSMFISAKDSLMKADKEPVVRRLPESESRLKTHQIPAQKVLTRVKGGSSLKYVRQPKSSKTQSLGTFDAPDATLRQIQRRGLATTVDKPEKEDVESTAVPKVTSTQRVPMRLSMFISAKDSLLKGVLTTEDREDLKQKQFALPKKAEDKEEKGESGNYPIPDLSHARNALAMVARYGSSSEQAKVRAAVYKKYPELDKRKEDVKKSCWEDSFDMFKGTEEGARAEYAGGPARRPTALTEDIKTSIKQLARAPSSSAGDLSAEYKDPTGKQVQSKTKGTKLGELIEQHHKGQQAVSRGAHMAGMTPIVGKQLQSLLSQTSSLLGVKLDDKARADLANLAGSKVFQTSDESQQSTMLNNIVSRFSPGSGGASRWLKDFRTLIGAQRKTKGKPRQMRQGETGKPYGTEGVTKSLDPALAARQNMKPMSTLGAMGGPVLGQVGFHNTAIEANFSKSDNITFDEKTLRVLKRPNR